MGAEVVQMMSVREAPWHLGVETTERETHVLQDYPGREEAMRLAGHFEVGEGPVLAAPGKRFPGFKGLFNKETSEPLYIVNDGYEVIQASELWDLTEAILGTKDVKWETAGTLRGGLVMWTLARVERPFFVTGDDSPIYPFVACTTTHDGKGSMKAQNLQTRIVCMNTHHAAERETEQTGREFIFRHVKGVHNRIEEAKAVLAGAEFRVSVFQELAESLATECPFSDRAIEMFINEFIPEPASDKVISDKVRNNIDAERSKVRHLFYESETVGEGIRNTGYGAYQVGLEYLDHYRAYKSQGTYFKRTVLRNEPMKKALVPMIRRISEEDQKVLVTV